MSCYQEFFFFFYPVRYMIIKCSLNSCTVLVQETWDPARVQSWVSWILELWQQKIDQLDVLTNWATVTLASEQRIDPYIHCSIFSGWISGRQALILQDKYQSIPSDATSKLSMSSSHFVFVPFCVNAVQTQMWPGSFRSFKGALEQGLT